VNRVSKNKSPNSKTLSFTGVEIKYVSPEYEAALAARGIVLAKAESLKPPAKRKAPTKGKKKPSRWLDRVILSVRKDMKTPLGKLLKREKRRLGRIQ
jgi:hypothetical protein